MNYVNDNNRQWTRMWQRLHKVKCIHLYFVAMSREAATIVNKLSSLRKFDKLEVFVGDDTVDKCMSLLMPIMSGCKNRIEYCRIHVQISRNRNRSLHLEAPSSLRLPKAQYVEICDSVFYRQWTNECTQLKLSRIYNINKDWCKFVIENCDCSNITKLILDKARFDVSSIYKVILKQLALQFCNLKTLKIEIDHDDTFYHKVLLFWQLLKPIISKNQTKVELTMGYFGTEHGYSLLCQRMDEKYLKIDKLIISHIHSSDAVNSAIKFLQERDARGLNHLVIEHPISRKQASQLLDELKCKSITAFELKDHNFQFANELLEWKMIVEKQIFVIIDVDGCHWSYHSNDAVLSLLEQLYQKILQLFVKQIAFDIKIEFNEIMDSTVFDSHLSLYSSYFENSEFLSKYNLPNCNNNNNLCLRKM